MVKPVWAERITLLSLVLLFIVFQSSSTWAYGLRFTDSGEKINFGQPTIRISVVPPPLEDNTQEVVNRIREALEVWNQLYPGYDPATGTGGIFNPNSIVVTAEPLQLEDFGDTWGIGTDNVVDIIWDHTENRDFIELLNGNAMFTKGTVLPFILDTQIVDAIVIFNGRFGSTEFSDLRGIAVHELGHLFGLLHSTIDLAEAPFHGGERLDPVPSASRPTMDAGNFAGSILETLETDDLGGFADAYNLSVVSNPEGGGSLTMRRLDGTVLRCDIAGEPEPNEPVLGANVRVVLESNAARQVARLSGFGGRDEGAYEVVVPEGDYRLLIEAVSPVFQQRHGSIFQDIARVDRDFVDEYLSESMIELDCTDPLPGEEAPGIRSVAVNGNVSDLDFRVGGIDLGFIIDDTGSMGAEIDAVRQGLTAYVDRLVGMEEPFPLTAVVTFKDSVLQRVISDDPAEVQAVIDSLQATGGAGCPESSNDALIDVGLMLRQGSPAVFATDASSNSSGPSESSVSELYRSKGLELNTLLSGSCDGVVTASLETNRGTQLAEVQPARAHPHVHSSMALGSGLPDLPRLGIQGAIRTFAASTLDTGGAFVVLPEVKFGTLEDFELYINAVNNMATSSVTPAIAAVSPLRAYPGSHFDLEIVGGTTNFQSTSIVSIEGLDVVIESQEILAPDRILARVAVGPIALPGFRNVVVSTALGSGTIEVAEGEGSLLILDPALTPKVVSVFPNRGAVGETLDVRVSAVGTNFVQGVSQAIFGPGVDVNSTTVIDTETLVANVSVNALAQIAFRDVIVETGSELADEDFTGPFLVSPVSVPIPRIVSVSPAQGDAGETLDIQIDGLNTKFQQDVTRVTVSGLDISVIAVTVLSETSLVATIEIGAAAALGFRDIFVDTVGSTGAIINGFEVLGSESLIAIDFKPGSAQNPVNLGANGFEPLAVLTTSLADGDERNFDASLVDAQSLELEGALAREKGQSGNFGSLEDIDNDGDLDLVVHFPVEDLMLSLDDTMVFLQGQTVGGISIMGTDRVTVVP